MIERLVNKISSKFAKGERGFAVPLVMVLLLIGSLIIGPLLSYMSTGLRVGKINEERMQQLYAADAGIEDAVYTIITPGATYYDELLALDVNDSYTYTLADPVNGISPVSVNVTRLSLMRGLVDESEYKPGQPHEGWINFDTPVEVERTEDYVEYSCNISFDYEGAGNRRVQKLGAFFACYQNPSIDGPYNTIYTPVVTSNNLESLETVDVSAGFQFVWTWQPNKGPRFSSGDTGSVGFDFKVYDPEWSYTIYFVWALVTEQDVSFVTNLPGSCKWLIEATAVDTNVESFILGLAGAPVYYITWQISP